MEQDQRIYALVAAAKQGDSNAFTELYNSSYGMVYHTCYGYLKNREDAEDTTQEVFIYIYNKLADLEDNYAYYGWLKTIAVHTSINKIRARKDNASYDDAVGNEEILEGDDNLEMLPDTYVLRDEKRKIVMGIMEKELSEVQYQTLFMYYYNDFKIEQIAQIMEVSEGTVKTRLKSAKIKVKQGIESYEQKTGDRLAINGAIPSIAMLLKASTNAVPVSVLPFAGFGIMGATGGAVAGGIAKAANYILKAGGKASASIMKGAQASGSVPGMQPHMPAQPQMPGAQPQVPGQMPGRVPSQPQVPTNPQVPGAQPRVPKANPARQAAKKTASGATKGAAKGAAKGVATKIVAGVVAVGVLGGGALGVKTLLDKNNDKPEKSKTKTEKDADVDETKKAVKPDDIAPDLLSTGFFPESDLTVGSIIQLGNYNGNPMEWIVLEVDGDRVFLMSKDIIGLSSCEYGTATKAVQHIYTYGFTEEEKDYIEVTSRPGEYRRENYKLYLMSSSDAEKYKTVTDMTATYNGQATAWWTATMSDSQSYYAVGTDGSVSAVNRETEMGIRPVMWFNNNGYSEMGPDGLTVDMSLYEKFLNNEIKVNATGLEGNSTINKTYSDISPDGYTCDELIAYAFEGTDSISYAYIDCGNDGAQELLIRRTSIQMDCELEEYVLVTGVTGQLEATYVDCCLNYRTGYSINKYGIYSYGGSGGASLYGGDTHALNRYGCPVLIEEGWDEGIVSNVSDIGDEFLNQAVKLTGGTDTSYVYIPDCETYYFKFEESESYYNTFSYVGDDAALEQSFRDLYSNYAHNYMSPEDHDIAYNKRIEKLGLTSVMNMDSDSLEIQWTTLR